MAQILHFLGDGGTRATAEEMLMYMQTHTRGTGCVTLQELADELGVTRQQVAVWQRDQSLHCPRQIYDLDQWRTWAIAHDQLMSDV